MSQCGVNIPLDDLVEAIVDNYADAFVSEITKRLDLSQYIKTNHGVAYGLTLHESLSVDENVKRDLCSILQDCIATKIQEELGCDRDNHVIGFYIDKEKDHLVIELKFGERYYVSRAELESWLKISSGGIKAGVLVKQDKDPKQVIHVTNKDDTTVDIDVSDLISSGSPYIVSGVFVERNNGYWLDFTRNDKTHVNVDMTDIINKIIRTLYDKIMDTGYRINTQVEDYTLSGDDFDGRTIVRADKDGDQTITIPKPPNEDFIGKSIIIRKTKGAAGTFVTLSKVDDEVSILPDDSTLVRRVGSSVTLVYIGDGVYDVYGELP